MNPLANAQAASSPRHVLLGGFLGAGRTAAAAMLARCAKKRGLRAGLIINGEGRQLLDAAALRTQGWPAEEIGGGCFSRRIDLFRQAADRLNTPPPPGLIIAEAMGTCVDLAGTLCTALQQTAGAGPVAPLSVVVDPVRCGQVLGIESGGGFSVNIVYVYRKQLEEAGIIVINKTDLVTPAALNRLKIALAACSPDAEILEVSARHGTGIDAWLDRLLTCEHAPRSPLSVDENLCAQAEALLGWLNCTVRLSSVKYFDSGSVLTALATGIQALLQQERAELAHLKMALNSLDGPGELAVLNLTFAGHPPELSQALSEPVQTGELVLNLRAEADPEILHSIVTRALLELMEKRPALFARMEHSEHFRPARKRPVQPAGALA